GVAEAVRARVDPAYTAAVDTHLAAFWTAVYGQAADLERQGGQASTLVTRAGLAPAPYLLRQHRWDDVGSLPERAAGRDRSPGVVRRVLGYLQQVLDATPDPDQQPRYEGRYAWLLTMVDPPAAQTRLRHTLDQARTRRQYRTAAVAAGD